MWNPLAQRRTDIVTARLGSPLGAGVRVLDADGTEVPAHVEHDGRSVTWLARRCPVAGLAGLPVGPRGSAAAGWQPVDGFSISNEHYRLAVDAARGGGVASLVESTVPGVS